MTRYVSYLRVSTDKQGIDGLGIEAQRASVSRHAVNGSLISEYVEVESGADASRPELAKALQHARAANATLIVAKLDRLSRDAHFLLGLEKAGVEFVAVDIPNANRLTVGIMAVVAEAERKAISDRTRAALAAAKARGKVLGNPNGAAALRRYERQHGNQAGCEGASRAADDFASRLRFAVERITAEGVTTASGIANALNCQGFPSRRGGRWHAASVQRLMTRLAA